MDKKMKHEFISMLKEARGTPQEWAVIMTMVDLLEDEDEFGRLAELYKGMAEYGHYLTEHEAREVVDKFTNYDGSHGPKWMPGILFSAIETLGGHKEQKGVYNCWAMYAVMNMMHSDYGGALSGFIQGDQYAKLCYMMAVAWFTDKDHKHDVRKYYGLM